jgi:hypothetical protein
VLFVRRLLGSMSSLGTERPKPIGRDAYHCQCNQIFRHSPSGYSGGRISFGLNTRNVELRYARWHTISVRPRQDLRYRCTERGQPGYDQATGVLSNLIEGKTVRCLEIGEGTVCDGRSKPTSHDRIVAQCFLNKLDIAEEMAKSGTVCDWPKFSGGRYKIGEATCSRK